MFWLSRLIVNETPRRRIFKEAVYLIALGTIPRLADLVYGLGSGILIAVGINKNNLPIIAAVTVILYAILVLRTKQDKNKDKEVNTNYFDTYIVAISGSMAELLSYVNFISINQFSLAELTVGIIGGGLGVILALRIGLQFNLIRKLARFMPEWLFLVFVGGYAILNSV